MTFALSKDLWKIAKDEIDSIRISKPMKIENPFQQRQKMSFDQIFQRSNKTLQQIMPVGESLVVQSHKNVPQSIKLLDRYAQKLGFLPMGQIYEGSGNKYIGRIQQKTQNGESFYKQFPSIGDQFIDSPDLTQNLTFKANRAISKWNQFIQAQSELGFFLKNVQTQQGRKKMIFQLAKTSTVGSDQLRMLSSLYYYYIDQKSSNRNILMLSNEQQQILRKTLKMENKIDSVFKSVLEAIKTGRSDIVEYIRNYHQYKLATIKISLTQQQFAQFSKTLQSKMAFVPDQMIAIPVRQNPKWFQVYTKNQGSWSSKIVTQLWTPSAQWFKAVSYLKV